MATGFGQALAALGAVPVVQPGRDPENLTAGMLVVVPALLISGIVLLSGSRHLPREMALMLAKLKAAPGGAAPPSSRFALVGSSARRGTRSLVDLTLPRLQVDTIVLARFESAGL